jgi:quercetin dioxygenase-like cupin family protein
MSRAYAIVLLSAFVALGAHAATPQATPGHAAIAPQDIAWGDAPASLPAGAQSAVLYGDPSKEGLFAFRVKFPKGYRLPPHSHPRPEVVTVISGSFGIGLGDTLDESKAKKVPAGGLFSVEPGMAHFGIIDEETVVQINSVGPWGINYINPKDDPRQKTQ